MTPQPDNKMQDQYAGSKPKRFKKKKTLLILRKLALICWYCENKIDYKYGNMEKFWDNIWALFKQDYDIDFKSWRQTDERWCEIESLLLVEEKIESGTMYDKNTFWKGVEEFLEQLLNIKAEKDDKK